MSWASWWNGWLFRVSSQFGVPHGRTLCTPHATKGQHVAPRWYHVFLHASGRLRSSASSKILIMAPLIVSSWWRQWWLSSTLLLH
jgi:hypothetical protein